MFLREIFEAPKVAAFAFGRMNPPTVGHAKLVDKIKSQEGEPFLFLTHTQKPKTDPLSFDEKVFFAQRSFTGVTIGDQKVRTIIDAMQFLEAKGYSDIIYVAGSDRVAQFEKLLNTYNGKDYNFNSIKIVSAGQRDPDAEGAEGMSATKMRQAAYEDDFETFKQGVASDEKTAKMMFDKIRVGMGVSEDLQELIVKQQKPKLDVLNNIASRKDGKPFPLSWNAGPDEISVGGKVYIKPSEANKFIRFYDNQEKENQELMQKALRSAKTTVNLFKNLGFKFTYKQDEDRKSTKQALKKGFDPATQSALANIRQKYPNARDPIDAILKYVIDVDSENDTVDDKINARFKKFVKKLKDIEPKLAKLDARLKKIEMESIEENFADGKKKGKSRPGRVNRSGASCKGSVTSLRAKAKKGSGERAKMYHWCANMKSGRKK